MASFGSEEREGIGASGAWSARDLRGYVGVSGVYSLHAVARRLEARWIGSWLLQCMCPSGDLDEFSPTAVLQSESWRAVGRLAAGRLPPMLLFHGEKDKTVP